MSRRRGIGARERAVTRQGGEDAALAVRVPLERDEVARRGDDGVGPPVEGGGLLARDSLARVAHDAVVVAPRAEHARGNGALARDGAANVSVVFNHGADYTTLLESTFSIR